MKMRRFTKKNKDQYYLDTKLDQNDQGYYGEAIDELATYENMMEAIKYREQELEQELEELRQEKKVKSMKFQQRLGEKMLNERILTMYEFEKQKITNR